jgi:hypothetical protein
VTATDYEGRQTTKSATYTVIDITKPHVIFGTPTDGMVFDQGSYVTADYACEDDPGGLGLYEGYCAGTIPVGAQIDTSQIGTFSLTVTIFAGGSPGWPLWRARRPLASGRHALVQRVHRPLYVPRHDLESLGRHLPRPDRAADGTTHRARFSFTK